MAQMFNGTIYEIDGFPSTYHISVFGTGDVALIDPYIGSASNLYSIVQLANGRRYGCVETVTVLKTAANA